MKREKSFLVFILLLAMAGCGGGGKQSTDDFLVIDVTKSYPKKELILQDIFDVEYIALETNDEFVTSGIVKSIGKDIIAVQNSGVPGDGDIFIFDRNGQGLRKINRKGQGPEEYIMASNIVLDEDNNEMFVSCQYQNVILVYDLSGNFKRRLPGSRYKSPGRIVNFDRDYLMSFIGGIDFVDFKLVAERNAFEIISKKDRSIPKEIEIPFNEKKFVALTDGSRPVSPSSPVQMIPHHNWIITEASSDTIYSILPDYSIKPFIARTPSIQSMDPEIFLFPTVFSDHYYFMRTIKKEYDFSTRKGFSSIDLVYDRQENAIYEYVVYNDDFSDKRPVDMKLMSIYAMPDLNNEFVFFNTFEASMLVEAYRKGELKGKLKEIAAKLDEDDNRVIMIAKHKKQ